MVKTFPIMFLTPRLDVFHYRESHYPSPAIVTCMNQLRISDNLQSGNDLSFWRRFSSCFFLYIFSPDSVTMGKTQCFGTTCNKNTAAAIRRKNICLLRRDKCGVRFFFFFYVFFPCQLWWHNWVIQGDKTGRNWSHCQKLAYIKE